MRMVMEKVKVFSFFSSFLACCPLSSFPLLSLSSCPFSCFSCRCPWSFLWQPSWSCQISLGLRCSLPPRHHLQVLKLLLLYLIISTCHILTRLGVCKDNLALIPIERIEAIWPRGGWIGLHRKFKLFLRKHCQTPEPPRLFSEPPNEAASENKLRTSGHC
jgi:hypothetical protein